MLKVFKYNISATGRDENSHIICSEWADSEKLAIQTMQKKYFEEKGFYPEVVQISCVDMVSFNHSLEVAAVELRKSEKAFTQSARTKDHVWIGGMAQAMKKAQIAIDKILFPPKTECTCSDEERTGWIEEDDKNRVCNLCGKSSKDFCDTEELK